MSKNKSGIDSYLLQKEVCTKKQSTSGKGKDTIIIDEKAARELKKSFCESKGVSVKNEHQADNFIQENFSQFGQFVSDLED